MAAVETALRDIWLGRVWRANAARVVTDADDLVALWMPAGAPARYFVDEAGAEIRIPTLEGRLAERTSSRDSLALLRPGARYSIWLFWDAAGAFSHWYVNFERTIGWNGRFFDMVDEKLDLIVRPDGNVRWKDEDELEQAAALGLVDADAVRAEAGRVTSVWPFPTGWEDFRPEPGWRVPRLPEAWERVS